jgi:hypothetical protein
MQRRFYVGAITTANQTAMNKRLEIRFVTRKEKLQAA